MSSGNEPEAQPIIDEEEPVSVSIEVPSYGSDVHDSLENIPLRTLGNGGHPSDGGGGSPRHEMTRKKGPFVYRE